MTHNGFSGYKMEIYDRAMIARNKKADLLVSIHNNSSTSSTLNGVEAFITANKSCDKYYNQTSSLANKIVKNISNLGIKNNGVKTKCITSDLTDKYSDGTIADYYAIIRYAMRGTIVDNGVTSIMQNGKKVTVDSSKSAKVEKGEGIPTILVEHCYLSNSSDRKWLKSDTNLKKLAKADLDAIVAQYGLKTKQAVAEEQKKKVSSVSIDRNNIKMLVGDKIKINANILPITVDDTSVIWESSNPEVATIDNKGIVRAVSEGTTTITVTTNNENKTSSTTITVKKVKEEQTIKINNMGVEDGYLHKLTRGSSISKIRENIELSDNLKMVIKKDNVELEDNEKITTGVIIYIKDKDIDEILAEYNYVVKGDATSDGKISALDYIAIKNNIMQSIMITNNSQREAADANSDGKISALDYIAIKNYIMSGKEIDL